MNFLITTTLVVCCVGLLQLFRLQKSGVAWARPATLLCALVLIGLAVGRTVSRTGSSRDQALPQIRKIQSVCGERLGEILAERHPGARVTILTPPGGAGHPDSIAAHLKSSLESAGVVVSFHPAVPAKESPSPSESLEDETREPVVTNIGLSMARLRQLLKELAGQTDVIVHTGGLAMMESLADLPAKGKGPALVVMQVADPEMDRALETSILDSIVNRRDNPEVFQPGYKVPKDVAKAFNQLFVVHFANAR